VKYFFHIDLVCVRLNGLFKNFDHIDHIELGGDDSFAQKKAVANHCI